MHPTNKRAEEKAQSLELLAFSASSWTEACRSTSTAYLTLWGVPLIASCRTSCAYKQADAELASVRLALGLASHTKSLLQHLGVDQLEEHVNISLKTSSLNVELVTGRPLAMQLGLSRRNKHIQLRSEKGQLQPSKVHPDKNLAYSLTNNASDSKRMLAKFRVVTEAAESLALSTVRSQCLASFGISSSETSFLVGMIAAEHPKMAQLQLRQLDLPKTVSDSFERTCFESLPRNLAANLAEQSFPSLTLPNLSLPRASLTLRSLSLPRGNLESLILHSLSLIDENSLQRIIFKEGIFGDRSLEETVKHIEHKLAEGGAGTNSFSNLSLQEELSREHKKQIAAREAETNSFSKSFLDRILSLRKWLQIFLLSSCQLTCAALLLGTYSVSMSFQSLSEQLCRNSFQTLSNQLCRSTLDSLIRQLDLVTSLSLALWLGSRSCRTQLQNKQVQQMTQKSFQLTQVQLCQNVAQGGVQHRAFSKIALRTRSLRRSLPTRSWRTRSSPQLQQLHPTNQQQGA